MYEKRYGNAKQYSYQQVKDAFYWAREYGIDVHTEVRLKDSDGSQIGVIQFKDAFQISSDRDMDLILINKDAKPPIFKIGDSKKEEYLKKKAKKEMDKKNRENARHSEEKTVTFGPNIGDNDFNVKLNKVPEWFAEGHSVKIIVQFRGREMSHKDASIPRIFNMIEMKMKEFGGQLRSNPSDTGRDWIVQYVKCKVNPANKESSNVQDSSGN